MKHIQILRLAMGALTCMALHTQAEDIQVFAAGASKVAIELAAPAFNQLTGDRLVVTSDTVGALRDRISQGERPDLTVLSQVAMQSVHVAPPQGRISPR